MARTEIRARTYRDLMLHNAVDVACAAHLGQSDKAGEPYIFHVFRVALAVRGDAERTVALLHDVVEDTHWTLEDLRVREFPEDVVEAVDALTRRKDEETYAQYVERLARNPVARAVKLADLEDNLNPARISALPESERLNLAHRYHTAYRSLSEAAEVLRGED